MSDIFGYKPLRRGSIFWGLLMIGASVPVALLETFPWESIAVFVMIFSATQYGSYMARYFATRSKDERYQTYLHRKLMQPEYTISDFELNEFQLDVNATYQDEVRESLRKHREQES